MRSKEAYNPVYYMGYTKSTGFNIGNSSDSIFHTVAQTSSTGGTDSPTGTPYSISVNPSVSGLYEVLFSFTLGVAHSANINYVSPSFRIEETAQGLGPGQGGRAISNQCHQNTTSPGWVLATLGLSIPALYRLNKGVNYTFNLKKANNTDMPGSAVTNHVIGMQFNTSNLNTTTDDVSIIIVKKISV